MPIKQKIKRIIISVFGKSVYDFIHHCSTFKITHSLDPKNIKSLIEIKSLGGFLIGGASQNPKKFIDIIKKSIN